MPPKIDIKNVTRQNETRWYHELLEALCPSSKASATAVNGQKKANTIKAAVEEIKKLRELLKHDLYADDKDIDRALDMMNAGEDIEEASFHGGNEGPGSVSN
jgi:negative regulator of replication initiation